VETEASLSWLPFPAATLFPGTELVGDPTNWWSFNVAALLGMLRAVGFAEARLVWQAPWSRRAARAARQLAQPRRAVTNRVVVHAWR
jgi:hypothetical protein